eukprot:SAG11_NODE_1894_length_4096_cov_3.920941_4_plen_304_part_00
MLASALLRFAHSLFSRLRRGVALSGDGYAARFRIVNTAQRASDAPWSSWAGDGFAQGPDVTGSVVFDPARNRTMVVYCPFVPGSSMDVMVQWLGLRRQVPALSADTCFKQVFLNGAASVSSSFGAGLHYLTNRDGSIANVSLDDWTNCSGVTVPSEECCEVTGLAMVAQTYDPLFSFSPVCFRPGGCTDIRDWSWGRSLIDNLLWPDAFSPNWMRRPNVDPDKATLSELELVHERSESIAGGRLNLEVWSDRGGCRTVNGGQAMYHWGRALKVEQASCQVRATTFHAHTFHAHTTHRARPVLV